MDFLKLEKVENKENINDFNEYKSDLKKLKDLLESNKKYEDIVKSFDIINNNRAYLYFLFFKNFKLLIDADFENKKIEDKKKFNLILKYLKEFYNKKDKKNINLYSLFLQFHFYSYLALIKKLYSLSDDKNYQKINKIRCLSRKANIIILKLFKLDIFNTSQIFNIMKLYLFLIENNFEIKSYYDKSLKAKNNLLFIELFFLLEETSVIIIDKINSNKNCFEKENNSNFEKIFSFCNEFQNNKEINSQLNMIIIINNNLIQSFIKTLLDKINNKIISNYEPEFKNKLLNFALHFLKFNYRKSKIFNILLNSLNQSFKDLYNFESNKNKIMHDLFINSFYLKLLKNIFYNNIKNENFNPLFDCFYFNGFDSQLSLNVTNSNNFENSSLFFSFYLIPLKNREQYPLFLVQKNLDGKKKDIVYLYIKCEENKVESQLEQKYCIYISLEGKEKHLEEIAIIKPNMLYYFSLCFYENKLLINFCNKKEQINSYEIKKSKKLFDIKTVSLKFGFYEKRINVFSGYFGPIIMIKNPKKLKEPYDFIFSILKLEHNYKNSIFYNNNSNYFFANSFFMKKGKKESENKFEKFDCLLYLEPKTFSFLSNKSKHLPNIEHICKIQTIYNIQNLNISLIKNELGIINFVKDNGLQFICLLYEYIYQFLEHNNKLDFGENNVFEKDMDYCMKIIISILKKTLYILGKIYNEIEITSFNKELKQIYMNLFLIIKIISKKYSIIDSLKNYFFEIIKYYYNYVSKALKKKLLPWSNKIDLNNENNNILKINLFFLNGWIDFLLDIEIYNFENNNTLTILFKNLAYYFDYIEINNNSEKINQHLFLKLLNFIPNLNRFINKKDLNNDNQINNINIEVKKQNDIFDSYFEVLKIFFESNPSKSDNIVNLENIFKIINEDLNEDNQTIFSFYNFINELINNDLDLYFYDDKDERQLLQLIKYGYIMYSNIEKQKEINEKEISNKHDLFNKLLSLLIKIIFSKQKIGKNKESIQSFRELLKRVELKNELILSITKEIKNIIANLLEKNQKLNSNFSEQRKSTKIKNKTIFGEEDLKNISNYYFEIFNLISFFLLNENNKNDEKILIEKPIINLLDQIIQIINNIISENENLEIDDFSSINIDDDRYINLIYCLINYLKFFNTILFQNIFSIRFIQNFIILCDFYFKSSLIYSNILIRTEKNSDIMKTPLEIIMDISIFYISLISKKYCDNSNKEYNKAEIIEEYSLIYNFLKKIFTIFPNYNNNEKELKQNYTIFYINDYFRLLSFNYPIDSKKKPKNNPIYNGFIKEFNKYQYINKLLTKEQKYEFNFSTFFVLKFHGYKLIISNLISEILNKNSQGILKFNEILELIIRTIIKIYKEHDLLYSYNKNFFFKKPICLFKYYSEVLKIIGLNINKENYNDIEEYILSTVLNINIDNLYNLMYSGLCTKKKASIYKHENLEKSFDETTQKRKLESIDSSNSLNNDLILRKNRTLSSRMNNPYIFTTQESYSPRENSTISRDDDEFELKIENTPSSEKYRFNTFDDSELEKTPSNNDIKNLLDRKYSNISGNSSNNISDNSYINPKVKTCSSLNSQLSSDSDKNENFSYINYFNEPDEYYLKNPKKELMMTVFSIYFFNSFFKNYNFMLMKDYYLQNFNDIQKTTKLLEYPSKIKSYSNGLEPYLFLKPFTSFFKTKTFPISHPYFYDYIKNNNINVESIILFKKKLPKLNFNNKFDIQCELIKVNKSYYGQIIGSKSKNYIIFEQQKFQEEIDNSNYKSLFTLLYINKKPFKKSKKSIANSINETNKKINPDKKYKKEKTIIILFDEIEEIIERRFLLMWQAIEIYLKNGKSYFFNLLSQNQTKFIMDIFRKNSLTKYKIHEKNIFKNHPIIFDWKKEKLSTYEYLLFLNKYSSRTFNDANQYPIFPWLIIKNKIEEKTKIISPIYRNFKYPMSSQTEENRENAIIRYEDDDSKFHFHNGTHYSASAYIYYYLMREEPFTSLLIKLQGYKHENPDRMFFSLSDTLYVLESGNDNRECIPDLFSKTEQFINLNCADFGHKNSGPRIDDLIIKPSEGAFELNNNGNIKDYVTLIIGNRKLLDENVIKNNINDWFDIIFGVGQLPEKNTKESVNIFRKETYEQKTNLYQKLIKLEKKYNKIEDIIKRIVNKADLIISFGQTPYQIFTEKHPKNEDHKLRKNKNKNKEEINDDDLENDLDLITHDKHIKVDTQPLFFEFNFSLGKIFLIDINRKLEIIQTNYYNDKENENGQFKLNKIGLFQLPHIKFFKKIKINEDSEYYYYINKQKYCFSSFDENDIVNNNESNDNYLSYYNKYMNSFNNKNKKEKKNTEKNCFTFITCRYMDNSFMIHSLFQKKQKYMSIICEDFVTSCCTLDHNNFLIGLRNGKLIQWSIENRFCDEDSKFNIKFIKQIQAHSKSITIIEKNDRLGVIITAGEDNNIFIRKIYDLELITPIKLKSKYIISMVKISHMNFLYLICFNKKKKKNKSIILGYTLNGLYFAKSKYDYYEHLNFTKNGNIVTWKNKKEIEVLYGDSLRSVNLNDNSHLNKLKSIQDKINGASWVEFNYFSRRNEIEQTINKIITYTIFDKKKGENFVEILDVSNIDYFN